MTLRHLLSIHDIFLLPPSGPAKTPLELMRRAGRRNAGDRHGIHIRAMLAVAMPGAPSSVLAPSSEARSP